MKSFKIISIISLALLLLTGGGVVSTAHAEQRTLEILNLTGFEISELYIVPDNANDWGKNYADSPIYIHTPFKLNYSDGDTREYKMRVIWANGQQSTWSGASDKSFRFSDKPWRITFFYNKKLESFSRHFN